MNIEALLEKYFEARTTLREEKQLREYFENENIPAEWKHYQPIFQHFASERKEEKVLYMGKKRNYGWIWAAAAAAVLFFVFLPLMTVGQEKSLAYIDGKKTTDMLIISREAARGLDSFASGNDDVIASQAEALDIFLLRN